MILVCIDSKPRVNSHESQIKHLASLKEGEQYTSKRELNAIDYYNKPIPGIELVEIKGIFFKDRFVPKEVYDKCILSYKSQKITTQGV